jgi:hypothetical protein
MTSIAVQVKISRRAMVKKQPRALEGSIAVGPEIKMTGLAAPQFRQMFLS